MHLIYYYSPPIYHSNWSRCVADLHIDREHLVLASYRVFCKYNIKFVFLLYLLTQEAHQNLTSREVSRFISSVQVLYKKVPRIPFNWKGIGSNKIPQRHGSGWWSFSNLPTIIIIIWSEFFVSLLQLQGVQHLKHASYDVQ